MPIELVFIIGMIVLFTLCLKIKANAFISLLCTALVMGLLSGMSGSDTISQNHFCKKEERQMMSVPLTVV